MKTAWKWTLTGFGALLALLLIASLLLPTLFDADDYQQWLSDAVEARTGRVLEIGALRISGGFAPRIEIESIRYPNAPWGARRYALEIERATLSLDLQQLLRGRLAVDDIELHRPRLWVERNADGAHNFALPKRRAPRAAAALWWLELSRLRLRDGEITVNTRSRQWDIRIAAATAASAARGAPVAIDARGAIEDVSVTATATAGDSAALLARRRSPLSVEMQFDSAANRIRADGSARDLLRWRGIDLQLDFDLANMPALSPLLAVDLSKMAPVRGEARLHQPSTLRSLQLQAIDLHADLYGLRSALRGEIARLTRLSGLDLSFTAEGAFNRKLPDWLARHGAFDARLRARLRGAVRDLRIAVEAAEARNRAVRLRAQGTLAYAERAWRSALPVEIEVDSVDALLGTPESPDAPAIGVARGSAELIRMKSSWRVANLHFALTREALQFELNGAIDDLAAAPAGAIRIAMEADDARYLQPWFDSALPPLSALRARGEIAFGEGALQARVDELAARGYGIDWSARGAVDDLARRRGVDGMITARVDDWAQLSAQLSAQWPLLGAWIPAGATAQARARLADDAAGAFHLTDLSADIVDPRIELTARGAVRDLGAGMRADLAIAAQRLRLARAQLPDAWAAFAEPLLALMPLRASARLTSVGGEWRLAEIEAESLSAPATAALSGEISAFAPLAGRLTLRADGAAATLLPSAWSRLRQPDAAVALSFDAVFDRGAAAIENLDAAWTAPDARIALRGGIGRLRPLDRAALTLAFNAARVGDFGATDALRQDNPVAGRAEINLGARQRHAEVEVAIGDSDLRGTLAWHAAAAGDPDAVPWIEGELRAARLDFADLFAPAAKKTRFFPSAPLRLGWIGARDGRIALRADEFRNRQLRIDDAHMQLDLRDGALRQVIAGRIGAGELAMSLDIDSTAAPPRAAFAMTGENLDTTGLVGLRDDAYLEGGTFGAEIDFAAAGDSVAAFAASANGRAALRLDDVQIKNDSIDAVGGDLFSNLVTVINPFRSIGEYVNVECAWLRFDIADGVAAAADALGMKTDKVTVFGGGQLDFRDESMRIVLLPKARKGFGINPSSLVKVVQLGGTLAEPRIEAGGDPAQLLQTGVAVWAGLATGGLSLLAKGLYDRAHANTDLCAESAPPAASAPAPAPDAETR